MTVDTRIELRLPVTCMYEAHGALYGYQTLDGGLCVRPCDVCLQEMRLTGESQAAAAWKARVREALDG